MGEPANRFVEYFLAGRLSFRSSETRPGLYETAIYFRPWWRSFRDTAELTDRSLPWLTLPAVDFVKRLIKPHWRVFEFGSGGSTVFFALRCCEIHAVEHDADWFDKVNIAIAALHITNCRVQYFGPEVETPNDGREFRSGVPRWNGRTFETYVRAIEGFENRSIDVVLVDGRARVACVRAAINKLRDGGLLILDDSERPDYREAFELVPPEWRCLQFPGLHMKSESLGRTTIWIVPQRGSKYAEVALGSKINSRIGNELV